MITIHLEDYYGNNVGILNFGKYDFISKDSQYITLKQNVRSEPYLLEDIEKVIARRKEFARLEKERGDI